MMSQKKIIVTIDKLGRPKVEAEGFAGASCEAATMPIEQALAGPGGVTREIKPEWYQQAGQDQELKQEW